jgi:hypothetical protein
MHLRPPLSVTPNRHQILGTALALAAGRRVQAAEAPAPLRPYKIFHVMSFDSPWRWTDGQWQGFRESLGAAPHVGRVFQMDVKRHSSPEAKARQVPKHVPRSTPGSPTCCTPATMMRRIMSPATMPARACPVCSAA